MYDKAIFAENLKQAISKRGLAQREVAARLETTETTISRYVTIGPKGRTPNVESLVALYEEKNLSKIDACVKRVIAKVGDRQPKKVTVQEFDFAV